jgi:hypothetical protein
MARRPRIHFAGALYHAINRGNRRQGIFRDEKDLKRFLYFLSDSKTRFASHLYVYALMKNHFHLLVQTGTVPLGRVMGIGEDELHSMRRGREGAKGRGMVAYVARKISGYTVREIADHFRRSSVTVGEATMKVEEDLRKGRKFAKELKLLADDLVKGRRRNYRITEARPCCSDDPIALTATPLR